MDLMENSINTKEKYMDKKQYILAFIFDLIIYGAVYKLFGLDWLLVVAIAMIGGDVAMIMRKMYKS